MLQVLQDYGPYIWDNDENNATGRITKMKNGIENLQALRKIFFVNQRANFEFAISENSLREVRDRKNSTYLQWAFDVLDHWMSSIWEYERSAAFTGRGLRIITQINQKQFQYLSEKDRRLIIDAVKLECDAFLTMDAKLRGHAAHIKKSFGLLTLQPFEYWKLLSPWAHLWV